MKKKDISLDILSSFEKSGTIQFKDKRVRSDAVKIIMSNLHDVLIPYLDELQQKNMLESIKFSTLYDYLNSHSDTCQSKRDYINYFKKYITYRTFLRWIKKFFKENYG
jgi:hypothetical protein